MAPDGNQEQRQKGRADYDVQVDFESDDTFYVGFTRNISDGGLFIATERTLPVGLPVVVRFEVPTLPAPLTVLAEVRWVRTPAQANAESPAGMGVFFLDLPPEAAVAINRFIADRGAIFFE
ncbi:MAG: TIGR02266 family protein [Deltaproteobacteria bacterium]|nr:TIGR02266 family protein [Deltaproteobacteria bacterium]